MCFLGYCFVKGESKEFEDSSFKVVPFMVKCTFRDCCEEKFYSLGRRYFETPFVAPVFDSAKIFLDTACQMFQVSL